MEGSTAVQGGAYVSLPRHIRQELLRCQLCHNQFQSATSDSVITGQGYPVRKPKVLGCLHTFCEVCLESSVQSQRGGRKKKVKLECAQCGRITVVRSANTLPDNQTVLGLLCLLDRPSPPGRERTTNLSTINTGSLTDHQCCSTQPANNNQAAGASGVTVSSTRSLSQETTNSPVQVITYLSDADSMTNANRCALCLETDVTLDSRLQCGHRPCKTCRSSCTRAGVTTPECLICVANQARDNAPGAAVSEPRAGTTPYRVYNTENLYPRLDNVQLNEENDNPAPPPYSPRKADEAGAAAASAAAPYSSQIYPNLNSHPPQYPCSSTPQYVAPLEPQYTRPATQAPNITHDPATAVAQYTPAAHQPGHSCQTCSSPLNLEHGAYHAGAHGVPLPGLIQGGASSVRVPLNRPSPQPTSGTLSRTRSTPDLTQNGHINGVSRTDIVAPTHTPSAKPKFVIQVGGEQANGSGARVVGPTRVQVVNHPGSPAITVQKPRPDDHRHQQGPQQNVTGSVRSPLALQHDAPGAHNKKVKFSPTPSSKPDASEVNSQSQLRLERISGGYGNQQAQPGLFQMPSRVSCSENGDILVVDSQFMCVQVLDSVGHTFKSMFKVVGLQAACFWGSEKVMAATHRGLEVYSRCGQRLQEVPVGPVTAVVASGGHVIICQPKSLSFLAGPSLEVVKQVKKRVIHGVFRKTLPFQKLTDVAVVPGCLDIVVLDGGAGDIYVINEECTVKLTITPGNQRCGRLLNPSSVAMDHLGHVYVCDVGHKRVLKFSKDGKSSNKVLDFSSQSSAAYGMTSNTLGDKLIVTVSGDKVAQLRIYSLL